MITLKQQNIESICHLQELLLCDLVSPPELLGCRGSQLIQESFTLFDLFFNSEEPFFSLTFTFLTSEFEFPVKAMYQYFNNIFIDAFNRA
jgi:hypothetical protein